MKTVILMRHAEAGRHPNDYERALTDLGRAEAKLAAQRMAQTALEVDWVLCSSAVRTTSTAKVVLDTLQSKATVSSQESLYDSDTEDYLAALREVPENASCVLLVGHNPTISALAGQLSGKTVSLSTAAFTSLELAAPSWAQLGQRG